jgi:hypothetical protein
MIETPAGNGGRFAFPERRNWKSFVAAGDFACRRFAGQAISDSSQFQGFGWASEQWRRI